MQIRELPGSFRIAFDRQIKERALDNFDLLVAHGSTVGLSGGTTIEFQGSESKLLLISLGLEEAEIVT